MQCLKVELPTQGTLTPGHYRTRAQECPSDLGVTSVLNLSVSFSSKMKTLGLREPETAKLLGEISVAMTTAPTRGQFYWLEERGERRGCPLTAAKQYSHEKNKARTCDSLFLPQTSRSLGKVLW